MKKTKSKVDIAISKNISYKEATYSQTARKLKIKNIPTTEHIKNMKVVAEKVFQPLREWAKHPIRINSMYRCEELNTAINGSLNSQHIKGYAIDLSSLGKKTNGELFEYIKDNLEFDQLIWEFGNDESPKWIHVSYINKKTNRNRVLRAKYRGSSVTYHIV